jgi:hypothetical protein
MFGDEQHDGWPNEPERVQASGELCGGEAAFRAADGLGLTATDIEIVQTWSDLGAGLITEPQLIDWLRQKTVKLC